MKLIPVDGLGTIDKDYMMDFIDISNALSEKYGKHHRLNGGSLSEILKLGNLENKEILELGCGSVNTLDYTGNSRGLYEPWLARTLTDFYGANVHGVDLANNINEPFNNYSIDLSKEESLKNFKDNSIDIACAFAFFDSPALFSNSGGSKAFDLLLPQLERIVKPDGYFVFETTCTKYSRYNKF